MKKKRIYIIEEMAPGDIIMLTAAIKSLVDNYGDRYSFNVQTMASSLWNNNPYLDKSITIDDNDEVICLIHRIAPMANEPVSYLYAYKKELENRLKLTIPMNEFRGNIHLSKKELNDSSYIERITGKKDIKYWIINSGLKPDIPCKSWDLEKYQEVVNHYKNKILFVQIGVLSDIQVGLDNVIDLRGRTTVRDLVNLTYHSYGVFSGITFCMHLGASVPWPSERGGRHRPVVSLFGGREGTTFMVMLRKKTQVL